MRAMKIENMNYKKLYEEACEAHKKTWDLYMKEVKRTGKLMEELERKETVNYDDKIFEVNDYWGDQMPMMAMEEAGEFIQAVSKMERNRVPLDLYYESSKENLIKEMADMMISMKALTFRYDIEDDEIFEAIDKKLEKNY